MSNCVTIPHKYCISRKKTNNAERIKPIPILNTIRQRIGKMSDKNVHVNGIPSNATNAKYIKSVKPKLINEEIF